MTPAEIMCAKRARARHTQPIKYLTQPAPGDCRGYVTPRLITYRFCNKVFVPQRVPRKLRHDHLSTHSEQRTAIVAVEQDYLRKYTYVLRRHCP